MSQAVREAFEAAGDGWNASIYLGHLLVAVAPEEDALPAAIAALIAPTQQRFWMIEWSHEDDRGWDVYRFTRQQPEMVKS